MELVYTNDKCIGCNKCIRACYCEGACIAVEQDGIQSINVDPAKCIGCGACIDACQHNAKAFYDDTERFFADLQKGESISLLVAPAFRANYMDEYEQDNKCFLWCGYYHLGVFELYSKAQLSGRNFTALPGSSGVYRKICSRTFAEAVSGSEPHDVRRYLCP